MSFIQIHDATEGNLKHLSLDIPREKLVVLTGLSGSGKSTLAVDVLFNECQRQYLEAIGLQGIPKPKVESISQVSPAILIAPSEANRNPRSTVGTMTDIYTDLRMVYEKLSVRACPNCGRMISSAACREETIRIEDSFNVYMTCHFCGHRMEKLTRTHFSFNTREGACKTCEGLGQVLSVNRLKAVDETRSLEDGAVAFWEQKFQEYQIGVLARALQHYRLPYAADRPVAEFSDLQKAILYEGSVSDRIRQAFPDVLPPKTVSTGRFEGVVPMLWRRMSEKGGDAQRWNDFFDFDTCPSCHGERLSEESRRVTVNGTRLPELSVLSLEELLEWMTSLERALNDAERLFVSSYLLDLRTKIQRIVNVGLGYLTLDRQVQTLSGGEMQRVKLAAALDSNLTGVLYILDEPTIGLHPKDTQGLMTILKTLRDKGNTVIVIEHDPDVMAQADHIIDIGPGAGKWGGEVIGTGSWAELQDQPASVTGAWLRSSSSAARSEKPARPGTGAFIQVRNATRFNLKGIDVRFPVGCLISVTGVSGSGKSTLVFEVLAAAGRGVSGLDTFDRIVTIEQSAITRMKRSNIATYSEAYTGIRKLFGGLRESQDKGLSARHFSFNTPGGRCEHCEGLGRVPSHMLFFTNIEVPCPVCGGKQFSDEVLSVYFKGHSIKDVLRLSVDDALVLFENQAGIRRILCLLQDVGLGYLELGQTLTTLSGGEGQRLKLAKDLIGSTGRQILYLMDEPTTGLHPVDVEHFLVLLNRLVDAGNTVIVVEHNQQVIRASDWVIDLGPEGGRKGGQLLFEGTPHDLRYCEQSFTARYL